MAKAPWKSDKSATTCRVCNGEFSPVLRRKHHCRECGEVVCDPCSPKEIPATGYSTSERACNPCVDAYKHTSVYPVEKVSELCEQYKQLDSGSTAKALTAAKLVLDLTKKVVPPPFTVLVDAASAVVDVAHRAVANTAESIRLACRVARINFVIMEMTTKCATPAMLKCTEDLTKVFHEAVDLLKRFEGERRLGWVEGIRATCKMYWQNLADDFYRIHGELTTIIQDSTLAVALQNVMRCEGPSIEDIRQAVSDEVAHVTEEIERLRQETGEGMDNIQQLLHAILDSPAFAGVPARRQVFQPRHVILDTTTILGSGAFGVVFRGVLFGHTPVAVKVPTGDAATVEAEMRRTMCVRHPNVVRIFGMVPADGVEWPAAGVVMELLGVTLETFIEEQTVQALPSVRMKYTLDIIAGMERVHSADDGVMHFDLKPANIMLTPDGRSAKIIDFGASQTRTTVAMDPAPVTRGTVPFMAPEMLSGARPTTKCDVYSFAVLLVELWTGQAAWDGTRKDAIVESVRDFGARPLTHKQLLAAGVPFSIIVLIDACWAQDPRDRPSFKDLAALREIENFYEAQKEWPAFLVAAKLRVSHAVVDADALPSAVQFVNPVIEQAAKCGATQVTGRALTAEQAADQLVCPFPGCKNTNVFFQASNMRRHFNKKHFDEETSRKDVFMLNYASM
jgi:hypothetical protein